MTAHQLPIETSGVMGYRTTWSEMLLFKCFPQLQVPFMQYYSQSGQDKFIDEYVTKGKTGGIFVEIGAYDGVTFSNTLAFERYRGWSGVCIEPIPDRFQLLQRNRTAKCHQACISDRTGTVEFSVVEGAGGVGMLSAMTDAITQEHAQRIAREDAQTKTIRVPAVTFESVMQQDAILQVDYISIDTEGHEFAILKTIDLARYSPMCLTVEENGRYFALKRYVSKWGYRVAEKLDADLVIVSDAAARTMRGIGLLNPVNRIRRYAAAVMHRL
jgi:FkbM family methyltransferase